MNSNTRAGTGRSRGFTLIELLVVILIIAIMLAMIFPAITAIRRAASVRKATGEAQQLANAIKQYYASYSVWPNQTQGANDTTYSGPTQAPLINALLNNPRGGIFLEMPAGSFTNGCYVDPWGNPYVVTIDENDNGKAEMNAPPQTSYFGPAMATNVSAAVAVASWGRDPDDPDEDAAQKVKRRIYSWLQ